MDEEEYEKSRRKERRNNIGKSLMQFIMKNPMLKAILRYVLIGIGIFFLILLAVGFMLVVQQFMRDIWTSILGIFNPSATSYSVEIEKYDNTILGAAAQVYEEEIGWTYSYGEDGKLISPVSLAIKNSNKATCCATYVACVLYASGYFTEEELGYNFHQPSTLRDIVKNDTSWEEIYGVENIQPGDVVFYAEDATKTSWGHVNIYAGKNERYMLWYDGGQIESVTSSSPLVNERDWSKTIYEIYRPPETPPNEPAQRPFQDFKGELVLIDEDGDYVYSSKDLAKQILEQLEKYQVDNSEMKFDTKKIGNMIEKYIDIEIKTSYPKIYNTITNIKPFGSPDGNIKIKRAITDQGKIKDLEYVKYEDFCEMVKSGKEKALEKFSINPKTLGLCIAKQGKTTETFGFNGEEISKSSEPMTIEELNYRKYIEDQIVPLNFLLTMHLVSEDENFMEDFVKLIEKYEEEPITLTYVDKKFESAEIRDYDANINYTYNPRLTEAAMNEYKLKTSETLNNSKVSKYYDDIKYYKKVVTTYTGKLYVTNADTWITTQSKKISESSTEKKSFSEGEFKTVFRKALDEETISVQNMDIIRTGIVIVREKISYSDKNTKFNVSSKSRKINVDKFVKLVKKYPEVENKITTSTSLIFELLYRDEKTQRMEKIMRFILSKLTDKYYGILEKDLYNSSSTAEKNYSILEAAQIVHDEEMDWSYYDRNDSKLTSPISKQLTNPAKVTCCATYVSCVLYKAGYFDDNEYFSVYGEFHSPLKLNIKLKDMGWEKIESGDSDDLVEGDIVFFGGGDNGVSHVQIYAGKDESGMRLWYNAGNTPDIQQSAPKKTAAEGWSQGKRWWAYRAPLNGIYTANSSKFVSGYYTSLSGKNFIIFNQPDCDDYWKGGDNTEGKCNRVATCIIASAYANGQSPEDIVENMGEKYGDNGEGDAIISNNFLKDYGLEAEWKDNYCGFGSYQSEVKEQIERGGYILVWLEATKKQTEEETLIPYVGLSGKKWASTRHWVAIIDYREDENGEDEMLVADSGGAIWYNIDEFTKGLSHFVEVNEIK